MTENSATPDLGTDAQALCASHAMMGAKHVTAYRTPEALTERARAALDACVAAGVLTLERDRGAFRYRGTEAARRIGLAFLARPDAQALSDWPVLRQDADRG